MSCGCGRNKGVTGTGRRSVVTPRTVSGLSVNNTKKSAPQVSAQSTPINDGLDSSQRTREKQRRQTLLKKLGKL